VNGSVFVVDPVQRAVIDSIHFPGQLTGGLAAGTGGAVYVLGAAAGSFYGGPVHRILRATKAVSSDFIPGTFYAMTEDEVSGDLYLADVKSFAIPGTLSIYTSQGSLKKSFQVQRGPGRIVFRR
jgi:hypothetical protein